jgi:predicted transcriptional regulator
MRFVTTTSSDRHRKSRTTTAIRFPDEVHERLRSAADEREFSINFLVVKAVEDFLERLIPADELKLTRS